MRELLYNAATHYKRGKKHADALERREALSAYADALRDLHAVKPQRQRDVLLARVYLARYQLALSQPPSTSVKPASNRLQPPPALHDLRLGYSYARTAQEPGVRKLAETLWQEHLSLEQEASG